MTRNDGSASSGWIRGLALAALGALGLAAPFAAWPVLGGGGAGECCADEKKPGGEPAVATATDGGLLVDLGNAKCPVMGGKPDGKTFSEWNGLRIGHCCPMCVAKFAAGQEKALERAGIEWKDAAAAVRKVAEAKGADREKALAALGAKWTVVRKPAAETAPAPKGTLIDLANPKCPVMGRAVDGKTWSEWNGLRIGQCCPGCSKKLLADPAKVLDAAKIEWKAAAEAVKAADAAKGAERAKAMAELAKKWKVVREAAAEEPKADGQPAK